MPKGIYKHKKGKNSPLYGIPRSKKIKDKIAKKSKGKHLNSETEFQKGHIAWNKNKHIQLNTGKTHFRKGNPSWNKNISNYLNKHHIDLDKYNNLKSNILYLMLRKHRSLHARSYDYLVKLGLIKNYISWFIKTYKPKLYKKSDYLKQKCKKNNY